MSSSGQRFTDAEIVVSLEEAMGGLRDILPEIDRFVKLTKQFCTLSNDQNLSKDETAAVYIYIMEMSEDGSVYGILNHTLQAEDRSKVRPWFPYLKLLDSATSKLSNCKDVVWRRVKKDISQTFRKGQKLTYVQHQLTSFRRFSAKALKVHLWEFNA